VWSLRRILFVIVLPLALGTWIYLAYRSLDLLVFQWLAFAHLIDPVLALRSHLEWSRPHETILFSLPDGIWIYSSTCFMSMVWGRDQCVSAACWISLPAVCGIGAEVLQIPFPMLGTFDIFDLLAGVMAVLLAQKTGKNQWKIIQQKI
jgi:hypothetical protein